MRDDTQRLVGRDGAGHTKIGISATDLAAGFPGLSGPPAPIVSRPVKLISRRTSLGLLCLLPAGCAGFGGEPPVEILLSDIRSGTGGGLGDAPLDFIIRIENTSPEPLTVDGGSYKIYLNDTYIGQGLSNTQVTLPRLGSQTITATVHISTFRLMGSLYSIFKSHQVSYRLQGTVYASRNGGSSHSYKATREGTVNLDELQGTLTK